MSEMQLPLLLLFLAAVSVAVILWRKLAALEAAVQADAGSLEGKQKELERVRAEGRERAAELESTRKQLQETRIKLQKKEKLPPPPPGGKKPKKPERDEEPSTSSAMTVVRLGNAELEAEHRRAMERVEAELAESRREVERLRRESAERDRQAAAAKAALEKAANETSSEAAPMPSAAPSAARTSEERIAALETQLEALRRAAVERERELKSQLSRAESRAGAAHKRASSNQSLYQVIKGQLEIAEDKLALYRRKYEGAVRPEALKPTKPSRSAVEPKAEAHPQGVEPQAPEVPSAASLPAPTEVETEAPRAEG